MFKFWSWLKGMFEENTVLYPDDYRPQFTGLEVTTYLNGVKMTRVIFPAEGQNLNQHCYLLPLRMSPDLSLTGFTLMIHKDLAAVYDQAEAELQAELEKEKAVGDSFEDEKFLAEDYEDDF